MTKLKAFRLDEKIVLKLKRLAMQTRRSEKYFVEEALNLYFKDYEDAVIAKERFEEPKTKFLSSRDLKKRLDV